MDTETKTKPPYVAYTTFKNFLGSLKAAAIPSRIDRSLLIGLSGSSQSFLMNALRFFRLIDAADAPTDALESLVNSDGDNRKKVWKEIFQKAYAPVLGDLDLARSTSALLNERLVAHGVTGETARKAFSFFTAGAQEAEIPMASSLKPKSRNGSVRRSRKSRNSSNAENENEEAEAEPLTPGAPRSATLPLNADGTRFVRLVAPATVSTAELERIKNWLGFQLIVEE